MKTTTRKSSVFIAFIAIITLICASFVSCGDIGGDSTPTRCQAITQKGTQCKRNAEKGSIYCWQHKKMRNEK